MSQQSTTGDTSLLLHLCMESKESGDNKHRLFSSVVFCDSSITGWFQW